MLCKPSSGHLSNCDEAIDVQDPKKLHSTCSGNIPQFSTPCLCLAESKESSPVDGEERKRKMDDDVHTSLASEGTDLFVVGGAALPLGPSMI